MSGKKVRSIEINNHPAGQKLTCTAKTHDGKPIELTRGSGGKITCPKPTCPSCPHR